MGGADCLVTGRPVSGPTQVGYLKSAGPAEYEAWDPGRLGINKRTARCRKSLKRAPNKEYDKFY